MRLMIKHSKIVLLSFTANKRKRKETDNSAASVFAVILIIISIKIEINAKIRIAINGNISTRFTGIKTFETNINVSTDEGHTVIIILKKYIKMFLGFSQIIVALFIPIP